MRRLIAFEMVTLDGCYASTDGDFGWTHRRERDAEWDAFVQGNAGSGGELVFGRVTYQMMAAWWPSPAAAQNEPLVAERMNAMPKFVCSHTLHTAAWNNTTVLEGDAVARLQALKREPGADLVILGSGGLVASLGQAGVIDEYQLVIIPIVLGKRGRSLFGGFDGGMDLRLVQSRRFGNGNMLLCYEPQVRAAEH
ncbi:dihydrofolate reductase family protein [Rhodanobacter sp. DHG33]|uniref:dihydrofolate reductase family protein n=1 Tax=Rhodanobacter sp. DHG33 TaxID=2775921 RepID=UPI00178084AF|nr:dihydrofolate reductase family protein [Rhodanobacter sp. DHG33]MBD8899921.1 dihydrofolate reductase family protein [Rhodanobacter sp. DHG33]